MNVRELIEKLQEFDPDAVVVVFDPDTSVDCDFFEIRDPDTADDAEFWPDDAPAPVRGPVVIIG